MQQLLFRKFFPRLKQFEASKRRLATNNVEFEAAEKTIARIYRNFAVEFNTAGQRQDYAYLFTTPLQFTPVVQKHLKTRIENVVFLSIDELEEWTRLNENDVDWGPLYLWCKETTWKVFDSPYTDYVKLFGEPEFGDEVPSDASPLISMETTTLIYGRTCIDTQLWAIDGDTLLGPRFFGSLSCG